MTWITKGDQDKPIFDELEKQTDRGVALISTAYLEERLLEAIHARTNRNKTVEARLFKGAGPLASFSAKIDLGFLLGIYDDRSRRLLHTIREVRNEFAHRPEPRDFNFQKIRDLCANVVVEIDITMTERISGKEMEFQLEPDGTPRTSFLNAIKWMLLVTDMETKQMPLRKPAPPVVPVLQDEPSLEKP